MRVRLLLPVCLLLIGSTGMAEVPDLGYYESFNDLNYCDTGSTTADWDPDIGFLHLHPYAITSAGGYNSSGTSYHLAVAGDVVYLADGAAGLRLVDVTNPAAPTLLSTLNTPGTAFGVALRGHYAYVADGSSGLQVIDIADPVLPLLAGGVVTPGDGYDVAVNGSYAFVADRTGGLQVVDVSNPYIPTIVASRATPNNAYGVELYGDYCYVAVSGSGLYIYDVSDPTAPTLVGNMFLSGYAWDLVAAGGRAYVACDAGGLWILDLANPKKPVALGTFATAGSALDVYLDGCFAYVSESGVGLQVVDVSHPAAPVLKNDYNTTGNAWAAWPAGEHCYVADGAEGLRVLKIRDTIDPGEAGDLSTSNLREIEVRGSIVFAASMTHNLAAYDISDPGHPQFLGGVSGYAYGLDVRGNRAYSVRSNLGLMIYDVSSPASPVLLSTHPSTDVCLEVSVEDGLAAVAHSNDGVSLIDVSDDGAPVPVGKLLGFLALDVLLHGDVLFVSGDDLRAYDVSDPASPVLLDIIGSNGDTFGMTLHGDVLYAICNTPGYMQLMTFRVSDPTDLYVWDNPTVSSYSLLQDLAVSGDLLLVIGDGGLYGVDISDPTDPVVIWTETSQAGNTLALAGDDVVCGKDNGLDVVQLYESTLNLADNEAYSLQINSLDRTVVGASYTYSYSGSPITDYYLSADGFHYEQFVSAYSFKFFEYPGRHLKWRAELHSEGFEIDGDAMTGILQVWWEYDCPFVESVTDVPNDQGRQVSLRWIASGYDRYGSPSPITEYAVYRRIDPMLKAGVPDDPKEIDGDWHYLLSVPACRDEDYAVVLPTLADSTVTGGLYESVFAVRALTGTPGVFYESPPDSGYSVDNLAPNVPEGLMVAYASGGNALEWLESDAADFRYFKIYTGSTPDFTVDPEDPAHETTAPNWTDPAGGFDVFYKVSAVDFAGNESAAAMPGGLTGVDAPAARFALHGAVPNPFNPKTTIAFSLPEAAGVTLRVYDLSGRLVATLLDGAPHAQGRHEVVWDGRDAQGRTAAAGSYVARLEAGDRSATRRMMLVR